MARKLMKSLTGEYDVHHMTHSRNGERQDKRLYQLYRKVRLKLRMNHARYINLLHPFDIQRRGTRK